MSHSILKQLEASAANGQCEQISLGGFTSERVVDLITNAFDHDVEVPASVGMIRFTFVVGGGKNARAKYDVDTQKHVVSALRAMKFRDDQGASCVETSAGCFKTQHDTGANLKYVHVYPRVHLIADNGKISESGIEAPPSRMQICLDASANTLKAIVASNVLSWSQQKRVFDAHKQCVDVLERCTTSLISGDTLTDDEQCVYEKYDVDEMKQKCKFLQSAMQAHVNKGTLTRLEVSQLRIIVEDKLKAALADDDDDDDDDDDKRSAKLIVFLQQQQRLLDACSPSAGIALLDAESLMKLYVELMWLHNEAAGGKMLSVEQLTQQGRIEAQINKLEQRSRNAAWFEQDEEFVARLECLRARTKSFAKRSKAANGKGGGSSRVAKDQDSDMWQQVKSRGKSKAQTGSRTSASLNSFDALSL